MPPRPAKKYDARTCPEIERAKARLKNPSGPPMNNAAT